MKNKNFLNKCAELDPKVAAFIEAEKKLLLRLKAMGYVLFVVSAAALAFAIAAPDELEIGPELILENTAGLSLSGDEDLLELSSREVFNYYVVSGIFALVGASCFLIVWKKRKAFS
jgi:hypothetical protein